MCDFCEGIVSAYDQFSNSKYGDIYIRCVNHQLEIWDGDLNIASIPIYYCPHCGCKLSNNYTYIKEND